ncbi:MAG: LacI family DNA-binding transcriptional regulator [Gammaproteobacteria bacterium]|nr:LacI family DNA-binding transcriptional regulator [Gammaproteobacteria bacterium]
MPAKSANKVTASDVALLAGVSKWTVSRAFTSGASISPASLKRVKKAAQELGYRPNLLARSLTQKRSNIVGLVVDEFTNPNILLVLNEVTSQLQRKGYITMLININADHSYDAALMLADQFQVDGVIFLGANLPEAFVHTVKDLRHIPLIVLYRDSGIAGIQVVNTDDYRGGKEIAELLVRQGHQTFAYMQGPPSDSTHLERIDGFRDGLTRHGFQLDLVLHAGSYQRQAGFDTLTNHLTSSDHGSTIDAMFCENDNLAVGSIDAIRHCEQPVDIAIVGFDGIELGASTSYNLSTYQQPIAQLAAEAIRRLENDEQDHDKYIAPGKLIVRTSHLKRR